MLNNNFNNLEQLEVIAAVLQVASYIENTKQTSNDKIMQELQRQNKIYLEEILNRLERLEQCINSEKK